MTTTRASLLCSLLLLSGCYESSGVGCEPALIAGDACEGGWTCPATSLGGSTGTHNTETRCEDGVVVERSWWEPYGVSDAGTSDAGTSDAGPGPLDHCDPTAPAGTPCRGAWVCEPWSVEGSTGTHWYEARCEEGRVVVDSWMESPVADAGTAADAGTPTPDAGTDAGPPAVGVPCGADTCVAGSEICIACVRSGATNIGCVAVPDGRSWWDAAWDVDCYGGGTVFVECDGPEDCAAGGVCTFSGGEAAYGRCGSPHVGFGLACHDAGDCPASAPVCDASGVDDLFADYFSAIPPMDIGWTPTACRAP